jgi:hypothetical protein
MCVFSEETNELVGFVNGTCANSLTEESMNTHDRNGKWDELCS